MDHDLGEISPPKFPFNENPLPTLHSEVIHLAAASEKQAVRQQSLI